MAGLTLAQLTAARDAAYTAYLKAVEAESYSEGSRSLSRDPDKLYNHFTKLDAKVKRMEAGGSGGPTVRAATPV